MAREIEEIGRASFHQAVLLLFEFSQFLIGRGDQFGSQWIDELAIYPAALSPSRVALHHALGE